jgi:hypothetical protein
MTRKKKGRKKERKTEGKKERRKRERERSVEEGKGRVSKDAGVVSRNVQDEEEDDLHHDALDAWKHGVAHERTQLNPR